MTAEIAGLIDRGSLGEAERACRAAIAAGRPDAALHVHLSTIALRTERPDAARHAARTALALAPAERAALNNLSGALRMAGLPAPAADWARRSLMLDLVQPEILSHLIFALNDLGHPATEAAARTFDAVMRRPAMPIAPTGGAGAGRLRIGFVSPDFRNHVCMTFLRPLLDHVDRRRFRLFAYMAARASDAVTEAVRPRFDGWRDIAGLPDDQAAALIAQDGIDVLVDLAGHTSGGRLGIFAHHPARTQTSWLGYNGTTGLAAMDWRIADSWIAPADGGEWFAEQVWRLPRICHCWRPAAQTPPVSRPPVELGRPFTFGSFNNIAKLSADTTAAWARILLAVPESRLLLKSRMADEEAMRAPLIGRFAAAGIAPDRILFRPPTRSEADHLAAYGDIDVALDPFPYNGTTTTCEALWMGVPVVALRGPRMLSRISYSLLAALRLEDRLAAHTIDEMVAICIRLAGDRAELAQLRREMRPRFEKSSLRDEAGFARAMERAFTAMAKQAGSRRPD